MDPKSQETLDNILTKSLEALTEDDKAFLRARRSYLNKSQIETYEDVLSEVPAPKEEVEPEVSDAQPPSYLSTKDLKVKAEELGVDTKGKSRQEIEDLIKEAETK